MSAPLDRDQADAMAKRLRAIAQPQRLMILAVLLDGERAVGEIEAASGIGQPALSQQLAELRRTGLVSTRRDARQILYSLAGEDAEQRVRAMFDAFGGARPVVRLRPATAPKPPADPAPIGAAAFARIG